MNSPASAPAPSSDDPDVIANAILREVRARRTMTLAQLMSWGGTQARGSTVLHVSECENLIAWPDMSRSWAQAVCQLLARRELELVQEHILTFLFDGEPIPNLRPVTEPVEAGFSEPHWFPASLVVPQRDTKSVRFVGDEVADK